MAFEPVTIPLNNGQVVLIDADDLPLVEGFKWYLHNGYACTTFHRKGCARKHTKRNINLSMHRLLFCAHNRPSSSIIHVDHINRDRLDNRKANLRCLTPTENTYNKGKILAVKGRLCSSSFKGVSYNSRDGVWAASCKEKHLGRFVTEEMAALAYDKAARHFFGVYAYLNFPDRHEYEGIVLPHVDYNPADKGTSTLPGVGVSYYRGRRKCVKRWRAIYKRKCIGYYKTEEEAREAYDRYKENQNTGYS